MFNCTEQIENFLDVILVNTPTIVDHMHDEFFTLRAVAGVDLDFAALRGELESVLHKIYKHLFQSNFITNQLRGEIAFYFYEFIIIDVVWQLKVSYLFKYELRSLNSCLLLEDAQDEPDCLSWFEFSCLMLV